MAIKNFKTLFEHAKKTNDINLNEFITIYSTRISKSFYIIHRLIKMSHFYSPNLSKDMLCTYFDICEIVFDPYYVSVLGRNLDKVYQNLFQSAYLYNYYPIDCKDANISSEQKQKLEYFMCKIYDKIKEKTFKEKYILNANILFLNLNIFNEQAYKDFRRILKLYNKEITNLTDETGSFIYLIIRTLEYYVIKLPHKSVDDIGINTLAKK